MPDVPEIPQDLTTLTREQLVELEGTLLSRFEELREDTTPEAIAEGSRIAETLPAIGDRVDAIDAQTRQAEDSAATVERYQSRRNQPAPADPAPETDPAQDAPPLPDDTDPAVDPGVEPGTDIEPVAAGPRTVAAIARRAPQARVPAPRPQSQWYTSLTAGAEIPGIASSATFQSSAQIADAVINRTHALTRSNAPQASAMIAQAHLPQLGETIGKNESASFVSQKMMEAVERWRGEQERRSLMADTGFCGLTETIYDLCDPYTADGMWTGPDIGIGRAGINFFPMPDISCFTNYSWEFGPDELECMDKPCLEIPCPEPVEVRPGVIGACLITGILQARSFPELVERYVRGILVSHLMLISKRTLELIEAGSDPVIYDDTIVGGAGFTAALLNAIELQAEDLRADYLLAENETIVVDMPRWVLGAIKADLINRQGFNFLEVTRARITQLFTEAGVRVNWIKGWQDECIGAPGVLRAYPTTVKFLIYREGAWVRGLEPIIELESQYDSVLLRQNKFTRLFTEQAIMVANLCTRGRVVTVPVCPNGATNPGGPIDCFSEACPTTPVVCPPNEECPPVPCCTEEPPTPGIAA